MINGSAAGSPPAAAGISAMNPINVDIVRSLFMPLFLGGTLAAAALAVMAILRWGEPGAMVMLTGGARATRRGRRPERDSHHGLEN